MIRKVAVATLSIVTLAGVLALGAARAEARPKALLCEIGHGQKTKVYAIKIDWKGKGMRGAVASCRADGGHPAGVKR
jgi:hypothetical protein